MNVSEAVSLARDLMNQHQLVEWVFELDRARRRAGQCRHRDKTISLSVHFVELNTEVEIKDTILHEIAHALAGVGHGHDYYWKSICRKIGARPERCYEADKVEMPTGRYIAICNGCKREFHKHRKITRKLYCAKCGIPNGRLVFERASGG